MLGSETVPQSHFLAYRSFVMSEESLSFVILRSGSDEESPARKREILRCAQEDKMGSAQEDNSGMTLSIHQIL